MSYADTVFINMCKDIIEKRIQYRGRKGTPEMGGWFLRLYPETLWDHKPL